MGGRGRLDFVKQFLRHDTRPVRTQMLKSGCTNREWTRYRQIGRWRWRVGQLEAVGKRDLVAGRI